MSEDYERAVSQATTILWEAVGSTVRPEEATAAAIAKILPSAVVDGKDGSNSISLKTLSQEERQLLDQAARSTLAQMVTRAVSANAAIMTWQPQPGSAPAVPRLLDMFLLTTEQKFMDPGLVFGLLEDLVETSTISECEGVFTYLEGHAAALGRPRAKLSGKHHMLRMCNQLLRRLSKGQNAVLCGRILIFLARLLPLSDRSGINLQGSYNVGNTTPIEEVPEGVTDSNGDPIDAAVYQRFWGLQSVFQNPGPSMKPGPWAGVVSDLQAALAEFQKEKTVAASSSAPNPAEGELPAVKYLSSPKLMRLQLQDATFRRHFLVQALIFLHCCQHPGRNEKETLKSKQEEEAVVLEAALYKQLEATPERGADFAAAIRTVLADETHWSAWKKEGRGPKNETCFPFERPAYVPPQALVPAAQQPAQKRQRVELAGNAPRIRMGSPALDRLWNQAPTNMSGLKVDERKHLPTLREFLDPVIEDMDPENCIENDFKRKHDKVYQWKALRMISRESLPIFSRTAFSNDLEEAARGFFPDEVPARPMPVQEERSGAATQVTTPETAAEGAADVSVAKDESAAQSNPAADPSFTAVEPDIDTGTVGAPAIATPDAAPATTGADAAPEMAGAAAALATTTPDATPATTADAAKEAGVATGATPAFASNDIQSDTPMGQQEDAAVNGGHSTRPIEHDAAADGDVAELPPVHVQPMEVDSPTKAADAKKVAANADGKATADAAEGAAP